MFIVALAACGGGTAIPQPEVAADDSFPAPPEEPPPVAVDLIADAATLAPGARVRVAVRFQIRPGWKIYWSNPGEAGLPTVASLDAPDGFEVGALAYPAPHAFEGPGGVRSYGYAKEVLLSVPVRVPDDATEREARFAAEAHWLACSDACKPGRAEVTLAIPLVPTAGALVASNRELFARHLTRVPVQLDDDACDVTANTDDHTAIIDCAGAEVLELFPATEAQAALAGQMSTRTQSGASLRLSFRPGEMPARVRGVLRSEVAGSNHYYTVDEAAASAAAAFSAPRAAPIGARAR